VVGREPVRTQVEHPQQAARLTVAGLAPILVEGSRSLKVAGDTLARLEGPGEREAAGPLAVRTGIAAAKAARILSKREMVRRAALDPASVSTTNDGLFISIHFPSFSTGTEDALAAARIPATSPRGIFHLRRHTAARSVITTSRS
jgi:hypothetical protein